MKLASRVCFALGFLVLVGGATWNVYRFCRWLMGAYARDPDGFWEMVIESLPFFGAASLIGLGLGLSFLAHVRNLERKKEK